MTGSHGPQGRFSRYRGERGTTRNTAGNLRGSIMENHGSETCWNCHREGIGTYYFAPFTVLNRHGNANGGPCYGSQTVVRVGE